MRVRATLRIRNEAMIAGRERLGLTQAALAELADASISKVSALEQLNFRGWDTRQLVDRIAGILEVNPLEIMPAEVEGERFETTVSKVADIDLLRLASRKCLSLPSHEAEVDDADFRASLASTIDNALASLSEREQAIVRMRFGLDGLKPLTLDESAKAIKVTRERIRQIEIKALRKLQTPEVEEPLREFADELLPMAAKWQDR